MAASISVGLEFVTAEPTPLFKIGVPILANPYRWHYDVSAGGQRFLVNTVPAFIPTPAIHVVLDWRALLSRREN